MAQQLSSLAVELLEFITFYLDSEDILSLRFTCRDLYGKTSRTFGKTCLSTFRTDLSRRSLLNLLDLAEDARYRHCVTTLEISQTSLGAQFGEGFTWHRDSSGLLLPPFVALHTLQDILITRIVNCRDFHFARISNVVQVDSSGLTPKEVMAMIVMIIFNGSIAVKSIRLTSDAKTTGFKVHQEPPFTQFLPKSSFQAHWLQLQELSLDVSLIATGYSEGTALVTATKDLQKLSFISTRLSASVMLKSTALVSQISQGANLGSLQELNLSNIDVCVSIFAQLLSKLSNTLEVLRLNTCRVDARPPFLSFLDELWRLLPYLKDIEVYQLAVTSPRSFVHFRSARMSIRHPNSNSVAPCLTWKLAQNEPVPDMRHGCYEDQCAVGFSYHGDDLQMFLSEIISSAMLHDPT